MTCPNPGEFIESIDPVTFAVTCHSYTSGKTCGSDQFLSNLTYSSGTYTGSCVKRLNPFTYYDFNPEVSKSSTDFEPYVFRGGGLDGGSYGYYNVDYPVVPPSDRACDANTAPW